MTAQIKIIFLGFVILSGCATNTFKEKTFRNMIIATAVGVAIGQSADNHKVGNSVAYAGSLAALTAVGSILYYDPDKNLNELSETSREVSDSLEKALSSHNRTKSDPRKYFSRNNGSALKDYNMIPNKYKNLISPGEWKLSQIDEWEQIDDYTFVHKTELFEIKPPQINLKQ